MRSLIDKLGLKPGARAAVLGVAEADEPEFWQQLRERTGDIAIDEPLADVALLVIRVDEAAALARLAELRGCIRPDGAIWVLWPRVRPRQPRRITEEDIRAAALGIGLVDVKVASFSERLSALKLVIPLALRPGRPAARPNAARG